MRDDYKNKMASKIAAQIQDLEERNHARHCRRIVKRSVRSQVQQIGRLIGYGFWDILQRISKGR